MQISFHHWVNCDVIRLTARLNYSILYWTCALTSFWLNSLYNIMPSGERQQLISKFYELPFQNDSAKPSCFLPNVINNELHEHHCIVRGSVWYICCSAANGLKCKAHLRPFTDITPTRRSATCRSPTSIVCFAADQCSNKSWTASIFPSFDILLRLIIIGNLYWLVC